MSEVDARDPVGSAETRDTSASAPWRPHRADRPPPSQDLGGFVARTLVVVVVIALALLLWSWRHVVLLIFASVVIAAGLRGLAKPMRRRGVPEPAAIGLSAVIIIGVIAGILGLFGAQIAGQFDELGRSIPQAWTEFRGRLSQSDAGRFALSQVDGLSAPGGAIANAVRRVGSIGAAMANAALEALLVVIAGVFFALSPRNYRDGALLLAPRRHRPRLREALDLSGSALGKWLASTLISMSAVALMVGVGLYLLDVPAPIGLALVAGIAQFVPLIGPILASLPAILLAFTVDPMTAVWTALLYFGASTIEANLLYPIIQKHAVSQAPVLTLYSVIAFGLLFGPLGVLLAVPITVVASIFIIKFYVNGSLGERVAAPGEGGQERRSAA